MASAWGFRPDHSDWRCAIQELDSGPDLSELEQWPSSSKIEAFAKAPLLALGVNDSGKCHKRRVRDKIGSLMKAIHKFAPTADVFFQQQPFLATVVWGACRFLLQAVVINIGMFDTVRRALCQILPSLSNTYRETKLFKLGKTAVDVLTDYFKHVILFLVQARKHFECPKPLRWIKALAGNIDEALQGLETHATRVTQELRITAAEAQVAEFAKQDQYRGETSASVQRIEKNTKTLLERKEEAAASTMHLPLSEPTHRLHYPITPVRIREWLANGVYRSETAPDPEEGTCQRLYSHKRWLRWLAECCPNTFVITGAAGSGKTVYAQSMANAAKRKGERVVLSYLFRASANESLAQARTFVISLLWQVFQHSWLIESERFRPSLDHFASFLNSYPTVSKCDLEGLLQLLGSVLEIVKDFLLVVDGLDELARDQSRIETATIALLNKYLFDLGQRPGAQVAIFTHEDCLLNNAVKTNFWHIRLDSELLESEIKQYVEQKVRKTKRFSRLKDQITETVLEHSQCSFLRAHLILGDLDSARTVKQQEEKMSQLSGQLCDTFTADYDRRFDESNQMLSPAQRARRDNIYRLLIATRKLLTAQAITEALDEDDPILEPVQDINILCRHFVKVSDNGVVTFFHTTAREYILRHKFTALESDLFLARKCLIALSQSRYKNWRIPARLLRNHILQGTTYAVVNMDIEDDPAFYDYATLHFQDHIAELNDPPPDIVKNLADFLQGVDFVSWSEHLLDLTKQSSLGNQIAVHAVLLDWTNKLSQPIRDEVQIKNYWEKAHNKLSGIFDEESQDKILQLLPLVRNGNYFNGGGQSASDWQKAYEYKEKVVVGFTDLLGDDSPVTLRFTTALLQEFFWQKRFVEVLPRLLKVAKAQQRLGEIGEPDLFNTLWLLGSAYHCLTRFDEALAVFTEAAKGVAWRLGKSDRLYLLIGLYKGSTLEQMLRFEEALAEYTNVKDTLTPIFGSANGFTLMCQTAIGAIQRKQGKFEHAKTNLLEGWGGRKKIFSIDVNVCLDAAMQLALLFRDNREGKLCLELLDDISGSVVFEEDFERYCQLEHIQCLVSFGNGDFEKPIARLLQLIHKTSGKHRERNNRELIWIRCTLAAALRDLGRHDEALMQFTDLVESTLIEDTALAEEPEPPVQLQIAEAAVGLIRQARIADAHVLLRDKNLRWVREADFFVLGEGGPAADTAVIAPIRFPERGCG